MTWTMFTIRALDDGSDGVLYPIPTRERNGIVLDEWDGQLAHPVTATAIELNVCQAGDDRWETILKADSVKVSVHMTESRVAFACSKYDKGGGWIGGAPSIVLNAASKAMAAVRSHGKSLVGQVRYPWVASVAFSPKRGWLTDERLRLMARDGSQGPGAVYMLDLTLPKSVSAEKVAREITQRAARFRLAHTSFDSAEARAVIEDLVDPPPRQADKTTMGMWSFKTFFDASERTAFGDTEVISPMSIPELTAVPASGSNPAPAIDQEVCWWAS